MIEAENENTAIGFGLAIEMILKKSPNYASAILAMVSYPYITRAISNFGPTYINGPLLNVSSIAVSSIIVSRIIRALASKISQRYPRFRQRLNLNRSTDSSIVMNEVPQEFISILYAIMLISPRLYFISDIIDPNIDETSIKGLVPFINATLFALTPTVSIFASKHTTRALKAINYNNLFPQLLSAFYATTLCPLAFYFDRRANEILSKNTLPYTSTTLAIPLFASVASAMLLSKMVIRKTKTTYDDNKLLEPVSAIFGMIFSRYIIPQSTDRVIDYMGLPNMKGAILDTTLATAVAIPASRATKLLMFGIGVMLDKVRQCYGHDSTSSLGQRINNLGPSNINAQEFISAFYAIILLSLISYVSDIYSNQAETANLKPIINTVLCGILVASVAASILASKATLRTAKLAANYLGNRIPCTSLRPSNASRSYDQMNGGAVL